MRIETAAAYMDRTPNAITHLVELSLFREEGGEHDAGVGITDTRVLAGDGDEVVRGTGKVGRLKNWRGGVMH